MQVMQEIQERHLRGGHTKHYTNNCVQHFFNNLSKKSKDQSLKSSTTKKINDTLFAHFLLKTCLNPMDLVLSYWCVLSEKVLRPNL